MVSATAANQSSATENFPNWLELPDELVSNILQRLHTAEILNSARKVCKTWGRICKDPALWKVIEILKHVDDTDEDYSVETLTKQAVHLSCGELLDISISGFGNDELLDYIVKRSSKLKSLSLGDDSNITGSAIVQAIKRVPQLEKLHLSNTTSISAQDIEFIGRNCPQLKSLKKCKMAMVGSVNCDKYALAIANNMPEIRDLELIDGEISDDGVQAIRNGCPHLECIWHEGRSGQLSLKRVTYLQGGSTQVTWIYSYQKHGFNFFNDLISDEDCFF